MQSSESIAARVHRLQSKTTEASFLGQINFPNDSQLKNTFWSHQTNISQKYICTKTGISKGTCLSIQLQVQVSGKNDKTFQKYQDIRWQYRQITMKKSCLIIITLLGLSRPGPRSSTSRLLSVNYWLSEIFRPTLAIISSEPNLQDRQFQARGLRQQYHYQGRVQYTQLSFKGVPPAPPGPPRTKFSRKLSAAEGPIWSPLLLPKVSIWFLNCRAFTCIYIQVDFQLQIYKCFEPHLDKSPMSGDDLPEADHQHLHPPANNCKIALFPNLKGTQKL